MLQINSDRPSPIQFEISPTASPGEKRLTEALHEWAKTQQAEVLSQTAAILEIPKSQLLLAFQLDWQRVAPEVQARAERAASGRLALSLYPEPREDGEFKLLVRTKDNSREISVWDGSIASVSIPHPELIPAQFGALQSDIAFGAIKRLNQWAAQHIDGARSGLFRLGFGEQKIPIFTTIPNFQFARFYWSEEEIQTGFRISSEFEFGSDQAGKRCIHLTKPNASLDPRFTPNLEKRAIDPEKGYLLVEMLSPQAASSDSPDRYERFIEAVFKRCNRGRPPDDLRAEARQFGLDASLAVPEVMSGEQLAKLGLKTPDAFKTESRERKGLVGSEKAKIEGAKALRAFMQAFGEDPAVDSGAKSSARALVMPMTAAVQRGQRADPQSFERLVEILPGSYAPEIERLKSSLT